MPRDGQPEAQKQSQLVTLRDIANAIGVSSMTVSLALRNHPRISEAQRRKIQDKAREMGYRRDPMLTALAHYRHRQANKPLRSAIAWINAWPNPKDLRRYEEFNLYWKGASEAAEMMGYRLEEFNVAGEVTLRRLNRILKTRNISGILIPPHPEVALDWQELQWERFSVVRFGRTVVDLPPFHLVTSDQTANAMMAFKKIREKGYKSIGFIGRDAEHRLYAGGFLQAQLAVSKQFRVPPLLVPFPLAQSAKARISGWLNKHGPDAILTELPDLPQILKEIGVNAPRDIGLATMTTADTKIDSGIFQNSEEIGRVAMLLLISMINENDKGVPSIFRQVLVAGSWRDGTSLPGKAAAASHFGNSSIR